MVEINFLKERKLNVKIFKSILAIFMAIFIFFASIAFWVFGNITQSTLTEQVYDRQLVVSRAGAVAIENLILFSRAMLRFTASRKNLTEGGEEPQRILDEFVSDLKNTPIKAVVLTDKDGVVEYDANRAGVRDIGRLVSERDYFKWAREAKEDEVYIGDIVISKIGETKGEHIIPIATPVFKDGEFGGVLVAALLLSELTNKYVSPLNSTPNSYSHIFDSNGNWLASSKYPELTGVNYFDYVEKNRYPGSQEFVQNIKKLIQSPTDAQFKTNTLENGEEILVTVSPIDIQAIGIMGKSNFWFLSVVNPGDEVTQLYKPFNRRNTIRLIISVSMLLTLSAIAILGFHIAQKNAYIKGFIKARDLKK